MAGLHEQEASWMLQLWRPWWRDSKIVWERPDAKTHLDENFRNFYTWILLFPSSSGINSSLSRYLLL